MQRLLLVAVMTAMKNNSIVESLFWYKPWNCRLVHFLEAALIH